MALLSSCLCCSLLIGSILGGVYTTLVYLVAFIINVWWIAEVEIDSSVEELSMVGAATPLPGYILCLGYLILAIMSVFMLYGLYKKREKTLMAWLFAMLIFILPEMGMVLFMTLYHWKVTSSYGLADLIFYVIRAPLNLLSVVCVHSQYVEWRDYHANTETLKRLEHLHLNNMTKNGKNGIKSNGHNGVGERSLSYHNPSFVASSDALPGIPRNIPNTPIPLQRSYSTASQMSHLRSSMMSQRPSPIRLGVPGWDPYVHSAREQSQSEFNAATFSPASLGFSPLVSGSSRSEAGMYPEAINPRLTVHHYAPQYVFPNDYFTMPNYNFAPTSIPQQDFSTQSLDRRRYVRRSRTGANGIPTVEALNYRAAAIHAQGLNGNMAFMRPGSSLERSKSSLGTIESDDLRKYRDVAL